MESFAEKFAALRRGRGLTQEEVAERFGVSAQAVSKWENGVSMPDVSLLPDIADYFDITLDELLGRAKQPAVRLLPDEQRSSVDNMALRVNVNSADGDKVRINLPVPFLKACIKAGLSMPQVSGNVGEALKGIDLNQIFSMIESGVVGELVSVESSDGDHITITVE